MINQKLYDTSHEFQTTSTLKVNFIICRRITITEILSQKTKKRVPSNPCRQFHPLSKNTPFENRTYKLLVA